MSGAPLIPLVVIVGPTGAGKSGVAEILAPRINGVLINGDSRQVYRDIDVVSAAPSVRENTRLYCFKKIGEPYSFAEYVHDADAAIAAVHQSGRVPFVVGGTGLYVDALVRRTGGAPRADLQIRSAVAALSPSERLARLRELDPEILDTIDQKNPRRVSRALEVILQTGVSIRAFSAARESSPYLPLWIGWSGGDRATLHARIERRVLQMWDRGVVTEVAALRASGHTQGEPGMEAIGIPEIFDYLDGVISERVARERMAARTRQYARRQMTWFRRNRDIVWYNSIEDVCHSAHDFLHKNSNQF